MSPPDASRIDPSWQTRRRQMPWSAYTLLWLLALAFAIPQVWMLLCAFKPEEQLVAEPHSLWPTFWRWENFVEATTTIPYLRYLRNSLLICLGSVAGMLFSCSLAAYAFARLRWPGRDLLFGVMIATMLLPWQVTMIPRFLLLREVGLYNSLGALIVPTFLGQAFYIFLLRQFFRGIPEDISEAARLDGCSEWGIFWRVILPLSKPALATVALFQFMASWNDFNGPLLLLSDPNSFPLAYGLERFVSSYSSQTHLLLAASVLFTLPVVLLFLAAQRTFLEGIATSGMKG